MQTIFAAKGYKEWIESQFEARPQHGRGELSRLARHLRVHVTLVSQILRGPKDFTPEQAYAVTEYFGLNDLEAEGFVLRVLISRAGTRELKKFYERKLGEMQVKAQDLRKRLKIDRQLSNEESAVFYSAWIYSAVRAFCSIGEGKSVDEICQHFHLNPKKTNAVLAFLVQTRLCERKGNLYLPGPQHTHVGFGSPHLKSHLANWRVKALESVEELSEEELMYGACLSISHEGFAKVREKFVQAIKEMVAEVKDSTPEELCLVNIDWCRLKP